MASKTKQVLHPHFKRNTNEINMINANAHYNVTLLLIIAMKLTRPAIISICVTLTMVVAGTNKATSALKKPVEKK